MSLTPVSREHLRSLKRQKDEEVRISQLNQYVRHIYSSAINKAQTSTEAYYIHRQIDEFMKKNMPEILDSLKTLFPDCLIEYQNTIEGNDGKVYDMNKLDENIRKILLSCSHKINERIMIEWS
jgi:chloramphenicol 3-O-phosphotransferase